jgi:hypothetical protein
MQTHRPCLLARAAYRSILVLLALLLAACAVHKTIEGTAEIPLRDLNVIQDAIPPILLEAQKAPYSVPADQSCAALEASVRALDEVLGPDLDAPASESHPSLLVLLSNLAAKEVRHRTEALVPYRGWVRQLSGAERHSKQVAACIAAGGVRRAFLRGLRVSKVCA